MKLPRILYVALLAGASAALAVIQNGVSLDSLEGPIILAIVGIAVRFLDSLNPKITTMGRDVGNPPGLLTRFFTE